MTSAENVPSDTGDQPTGQPIALVREAFETEWRAGRNPAIEDYLQGSSNVHGAALLRELVTLEIDYRERAGERPEAAEYRKRFAEHATTIDSLFEQRQQEATPGSEAAAQFSTQTYPAPSGDEDATLPPSGDSPGGSPDSSQHVLHSWVDYEIIDEIARGGMGIVYKAWQRRTNRVVALKMIQSGQLANEEEIGRFHAEAEAAAHLDHPNIVPVYDVGEHEGHHYFSMGYVEGENLRRRVLDGPLANREAARILRIVAEAMAYAHHKGIIHRDLKPENVLIDQAGQPKITDFGLAKRIHGDSNLTATGQVLGTPSYMSPEQAGGLLDEIGPATDVYALGAVLYCLLTGRPPFQAAHVLDTLLQVMHREPVSPRELNPAVDRDLETLCLKCLDKEPGRRVASAWELSEELGRYLDGKPIRARPIGRAMRLWRWCGRNRLVASLASVVLITLIVGASVSTYFAILARDRAVRAEQGTQMAVRTLQSVVHNVQNKLEPFPDAREVRRELLREALRDLDRLSSEFGGETDVDHSTAVALTNLGEVFEEFGAIDAGSTSAAERNYHRAIDIYRQLLQRDPGNLETQIELTRPLEDLGNLYLYSGKSGAAEAPLKESLSIRRAALEAKPASMEYRRHLSYALMNYGDVLLEKKRYGKARKLFEEAVVYGREVVETDPDEIRHSDMLLLAYEKLGDACLDSQDFAAAKAAYQSEYDIGERLYKQHPSNAQVLLAFSSACERIGDYLQDVGDRTGARAKYERMLELSEQMVEADPTNLQLQEALGVACDRVGESTFRLGDLKAAHAAFQRAVEVRSALLERDSTNRKLQRDLTYAQSRAEMIEKHLTRKSTE